jgi:hypothetical protein
MKTLKVVGIGLISLKVMLILISCKTSKSYDNYVNENNKIIFNNFKKQNLDECYISKMYPNSNIRYFSVNLVRKCVNIQGPLTPGKLRFLIDENQKKLKEKQKKYIEDSIENLKFRNKNYISIYFYNKNDINENILSSMEYILKLVYDKFENNKPLVNFFFVKNAEEVFKNVNKIPEPE